MTLISSPAGFGKTTLVSEWADNIRLDAGKDGQIANRIAWLSLDENDNDPARFLAYFVAALNQIKGIESTIGIRALNMLQSPQPPRTEAVLTSLDDIAALETRTEGWIAGMQLAAISMQGRKDIASLIESFTGSHRFVLDYLIEEVLEQQSESVQTF